VTRATGPCPVSPGQLNPDEHRKQATLSSKPGNLEPGSQVRLVPWRQVADQYTSKQPSADAHDELRRNPLLGLSAVFTAAFSSAFASVYFERILKVYIYP